MTGLRVAGLFAGIGGIELGLERAGHSAVLLNELDPSAHRVLRQHFPEPRHTDDIRELKRLPRVDLVSAGFPCTDISQAGKKAGIGGVQSGLVNEVFRLVEDSRVRPEFLLLENVSYLLNLAQGAGVTHLIEAVERLGYRWAYRCQGIWSTAASSADRLSCGPVPRPPDSPVCGRVSCRPVR